MLNRVGCWAPWGFGRCGISATHGESLHDELVLQTDVAETWPKHSRAALRLLCI